MHDIAYISFDSRTSWATRRRSGEIYAASLKRQFQGHRPLSASCYVARFFKSIARANHEIEGEKRARDRRSIRLINKIVFVPRPFVTLDFRGRCKRRCGEFLKRGISYTRRPAEFCTHNRCENNLIANSIDGDRIYAYRKRRSGGPNTAARPFQLDPQENTPRT